MASPYTSLITTLQNLPIKAHCATHILTQMHSTLARNNHSSTSKHPAPPTSAITPSTHLPHMIIAGLGNHGDTYKHNRHNIGFLIAEKLALSLGLAFHYEKRFHALIAQYPSLHIIKPCTFMNHSGKALAALAHFYKQAHICVIHDELDLPIGVIRYKYGGSSGGHNGLKSIDAALQHSSYMRLRFGIKQSSAHSITNKQQHIINFVLGDFDIAKHELEGLIDSSVRGLLFFLCTRDLLATQNFFSLSPTNKPNSAHTPSVQQSTIKPFSSQHPHSAPAHTITATPSTIKTTDNATLATPTSSTPTASTIAQVAPTKESPPKTCAISAQNPITIKNASSITPTTSRHR